MVALDGAPPRDGAHDPSEVDSASGEDLRVFTASVSRSAVGALLGALIGSLAAFVFYVLVPGSYAATATVRINAISSTPFANDRSESSLIDAATETALATSDDVVELAVTTYGPLDVDPVTLRRSLEVFPAADSSVVAVSSSAASAQVARSQADAVARAYLDYRGQAAEDRRDNILRDLERATSSLTERQAELTAQANAAPARSQARARALAQARLLDSQIVGLDAKRNDLVGIDTSGGTVLNSAATSPAYLSPSPRLVLASGTLGGAVLGLASWILWRRLRTRVRDLEDLDRLPSLATADRTSLVLTRGRNGAGDGPDPAGLRAARERLCTTHGPVGVARLLQEVTGPRRRLAVDLGHTMSQRAERTSLVVLGVAAEDRAWWSASKDDARRDAHHDRGSRFSVVVCPVEDDPDEPDDCYTHAARRAVRSLRAHGGVLVCDDRTPSEATRLATLADADVAILVAVSGETRLDTLARWAEEARAAHVPISVLFVKRASRRRR